MAIISKDPDEKLDYAIDWSKWLPAGDSVADADWTAPEGITVASSPSPSLASNKAIVWLEGGSPGRTYKVLCRMTSAQGRIAERSLTIYVQQR